MKNSGLWRNIAVVLFIILAVSVVVGFSIINSMKEEAETLKQEIESLKASKTISETPDKKTPTVQSRQRNPFGNGVSTISLKPADKFENVFGVNIFAKQDKSSEYVSIALSFPGLLSQEALNDRALAEFSALLFGRSITTEHPIEKCNAMFGKNFAFRKVRITRDRLMIVSMVHNSRIGDLLAYEFDVMQNFKINDVEYKNLQTYFNEKFRPANVKYIDDVVNSNIFGNEHPYGKRTFFTKKDFEQISKDSVNNFINKYFKVPSSIVVVGDITPDKVVEDIRSYLSPDVTPPQTLDVEQVAYDEPVKRYFKVNFLKDKIVTVNFNIIGYDEKEKPLVYLAAFLLKNRLENRLAIKDKLVDEKYSRIEIHEKLNGQVIVNIKAFVKTGLGIQDVEKGIWDEIVLIKKTLASELELKRVKKSLRSEIMASSYSITKKYPGVKKNRMLETIAIELCNIADTILPNNRSFIDEFSKANSKQIQNMAIKYFSNKNSITVILTPPPKEVSNGNDR